MTASPAAITAARASRARGESVIGCSSDGLRSQVVQGTGATYGQQVENHDDDWDRGDRSGHRQVVRGTDVGLDQIAEQLVLATDDLDGDVVAEAQREREDRSGYHRGEHQRQ